MPMFKKKPVIVEAEQYTHTIGPVRGICTSSTCDIVGQAHVHTIHDNRVVFLEFGDWILPEPDGKHFYPVKPDIFRNTYEPVSQREMITRSEEKKE